MAYRAITLKPDYRQGLKLPAENARPLKRALLGPSGSFGTQPGH
jgi:hypothetical protein